jgi:cyclophilin family peptidyl-prolyl cis-trans isomerase
VNAFTFFENIIDITLFFMVKLHIIRKGDIMKRSLIFIFCFMLASACSAMSTPPAKEGDNMAKSNKVVMETTKGNMTIELYPDKAPKTVENFLAYVDSGFYDGTIFHRVIPGFMIQGGGMTSGMAEKLTRSPIKNEAGNGLLNTRGTLAMARTNVVDSATSQFFINVVDNAFLNHKDETPLGFGYCVFGKVTEGMDVVDSIAAVRTQTRGSYQNVPAEDVVIISAKRM